jgi:hypothetical protein
MPHARSLRVRDVQSVLHLAQGLFASGLLALNPPPRCAQDEGMYKKLPEANEDELDMLDLAFGLTDT